MVCLDYPQVIEHIDLFPSERELDERLDTFVSEIINAKVTYDPIHDAFIVPKAFQTYSNDFGGSEREILRFIFRYFNSEDICEEKAMKEICDKKSILIKYD